MASELGIIRDLAVVMMGATVMVLLFHKLKLPTILGYLAAGFLIGPHTPLRVALVTGDSIQSLRDLGLILLLFALGLEFNLRKMKRVGGVAIIAGSLEIAFMLGLGFVVGQALGWTALQSLFLGSVLAISSSTIIVAVLMEQGKVGSDFATLIFGILIVEDLAAVVLITFLGGVVGAGAATIGTVGLVLGSVILFAIAALVLGIVVVPRLIDAVRRLPLEEALVVTVLGLAFGMSMLATELGFSLALGAFIVGAVISEARSAAHVEQRIAPVRHMFTAVFFVAVGMFIDPAVVAASWFAILVITVAAIAGKIVAVSFGSFIAGYPPRTALEAGIGLAMIGEFSFIIAGIAQPVLPELFPVAVVVSAITTLVTPLLIRASPRIMEDVGRHLPASLVTYTTMYRSWTRRLRTRSRTRREVIPRASVLRLTAYAIVVAAGFIAASILDDVLVAYVGAYPLAFGGIRVDGVAIAVWATFGVLAVPAVAAGARHLDTIITRLAETAIPARIRERPESQIVRRVLRSTFWLFATVATAVAFLLLAAPFLPSLPVVLVTAGLVVVASVALLDATKRLDQRLEEAVDAVIAEVPEEADTREEVRRFIREAYPWDVRVERVLVPDDAASAGRTIRDLALRGATGASVVAIERGETRLVSPPPDTPLVPGDVAIVIGEEAQVQAARALLTATGPGGARARPDLGVEPILVPPGSPLAGVTLQESGIRERSGALVVGLRRPDGHVVSNPSAGTRVEAGAELLVFGTPDQVQAAARLVAGEDPPR